MVTANTETEVILEEVVITELLSESTQGPQGIKGDRGDRGESGEAGDITTAELSIDPVLIFENALI